MLYEEQFNAYITFSGLFKRREAFLSPKQWDDYEEAVDLFNSIHGTTLNDWKVTDGGSSLTLKVGNLLGRVTITVIPRSETLKAVIA